MWSHSVTQTSLPSASSYDTRSPLIYLRARPRTIMYHIFIFPARARAGGAAQRYEANQQCHVKSSLSVIRLIGPPRYLPAPLPPSPPPPPPPPVVHFIVILHSHLLQSICTVAFDHSRVKIPLPAAVSLHTYVDRHKRSFSAVSFSDFKYVEP